MQPHDYVSDELINLLCAQYTLPPTPTLPSQLNTTLV